MKTYDRGSSLFWLFLSIYVSIASFRMGIGTPRSPGMGFMTFGSSVLLGIFSLIIFFRTFLKREETEITSVAFSGIMWQRILLVLIALLVYVMLLPVLGYMMMTFLLMSFLFWILKGTKWWWVLGSSFVTTIATYYVFSKWLNCQFPEGIFGL
jgi:hypothetical protein